MLLCFVGAAKVHAAAPSVRLSPARGAVDVAVPWTSTLTVRTGGSPYRGRAPRMIARLGTSTRAFRVRRAGRGVYRATVVVDSVGRWTITALVARRKLRVGTLVAKAALTNAVDVAVLPDGRLLVPDLSNYVYAAPAGGELKIAAGNGRPGSSGDGGPATAAAVGFPVEVAVDPGGGFGVAQGNRVRHVAVDGTITTVGTFDSPTALAYDGDGNLFVSELAGRIRRVDGSSGSVTTYAGTGAAGFDGDGGPASVARLDQPHGLAVDAEGNLFVCDVANHRVRRVDRHTGRITTIVAGLGVPVDATVAPDGSLYVADFGDNRIVRVANGALTSVVTAVGPNSVAVDAARSVYFTERTLPHVRRFDPATGRVSVVLGR
jgi:sugar lactone lactonase YvrE